MRDPIRKQFSMQRCHAKYRGIDFEFTFEEWVAFWEASGHFHERGREKGQYVMSRYGDVGPYSPSNVFIQVNADNSRDACKGKSNLKNNGRVLPKYTCPHCGKQGDMGNLNRWHNDRCKKAPPK